MLDSLLLQDDPYRTTLTCGLSIERRRIHHDSEENEESHVRKVLDQIKYDTYYTLV